MRFNATCGDHRFPAEQAENGYVFQDLSSKKAAKFDFASSNPGIDFPGRLPQKRIVAAALIVISRFDLVNRPLS